MVKGQLLKRRDKVRQELGQLKKESTFKLTRKWTIIFISIMLFFTFFSKTIFNFLTPKVKIESVQGGIITKQDEFKNIAIDYTAVNSLRGPCTFEIPLYIQSIEVGENQDIRAGEPILKFEEEECKVFDKQLSKQINEIEKRLEKYEKKDEYIQEKYERAIKKLEEEMVGIEDTSEYKTYVQRKKEKQQEIASYEEEVSLNQELYEGGLLAAKVLEESNSKLNNAKEQLEIIEEDYKVATAQYIKAINDKKEEIENAKQEELFALSSGEDVDSLLEELKEAKALYEKLEDILMSKTIVAPIDGRVEKILVKEGESYGGREIICTIIPQDSPYELIVQLDEEQEELWQKATQAYLLSSNRQYEVALGNIRSRDGSKWGRFNVTDTEVTIDEKDLSNLSLIVRKQSEGYAAVVPRSAVVDHKVYVITEEDGFWGKEYYVDLQEVIVGESNETSVGILSGLMQEQRIAVYWDRPLEQGQRVIIQ